MYTKGEAYIDTKQYPARVFVDDGSRGLLLANCENSLLPDGGKANAQESLRRWNSQPALLAACEKYLAHMDTHNRSEHPKANMFCTACPEHEKEIKAAVSAANVETTQNKDVQDGSG